LDANLLADWRNDGSQPPGDEIPQALGDIQNPMRLRSLRALQSLRDEGSSHPVDLTYVAISAIPSKSKVHHDRMGAWMVRLGGWKTTS
jgi:hypothetical protein